MGLIEILKVIAAVFGGLALFMFGMDTMSESLAEMTGGALDKVLGVVTKNRTTAFLFGTVFTAVVQSSAAVSVLTVGLVNSGVIKLAQALGILIGGGLGSTMTSWLLSLNALDGESLMMTVIKPEFFAPVLALVGVVITMFAKNEKTKTIAVAILGFAVMMIGMNLISEGVAPINEIPAMQKLLRSFTNPVIGFLFSLVFTMILQESDATVGIYQAFALSFGVTFGMAIPLLCGAQVGTCVVALISSVGASNNGRRTALMNLYYAILKAVPFLILFYAINFIHPIWFLNAEVGAIGIPLAHTGINLFGALLWVPGGSFIVALANKTIPYSEKEKQEQENTLTMLDKNLLKNTAIALEQVNRAVQMLGGTIERAMRAAVRDCMADEVNILFDRIRQFRDQIDRYLADVSAHANRTDATKFAMLLTNVNSAFGDIGEISEELKELYIGIAKESDNGVFSDEELLQIRVLKEAVTEILDLTIMGYETKDATLSQTIQIYREEVMAITDILKKRLILKVHKEGGRTAASSMFTTLCYHLERLIEYCDIVADSLIKYNRAVNDGKKAAPVGEEAARKRIRMLFLDKYELLHIGFDAEDRVIDLAE